MMLSEPDLMEAIFETALKGCDVNVSARKNALWNAAVCLLADVLRETDQLGRERLLHGLVSELRASVDHLGQLLAKDDPSSPYPRAPQ